MASAPQPTDVGFAEFVATLLSETADSMVASQTDQEQRREAMLAAAELDTEAFAATYVGDGDVQLKAAELFPDGEGGTRLDPGTEPPSGELLDELGVRLGRSDLDASGLLTESGVATVTAGLRLLVADERLRALQRAAGRGLPRVVVDHGRIVARMTFQTVVPGSDEESAEESAEADAIDVVAARPLRLAQPLRVSRPLAGVAASPTLSGLSASRLAATLPAAVRDLRMAVHPARADDATATAQVFGEVELTFRTVP